MINMLEALYFKCYYAYLKKNLEETKMFFELLRDELKNTSEENPLPTEYLKELKKIRESLRTGSVLNDTWVENNVPIKIPKMSGSKFNGDQDELVKKIHYEAADELKNILNAPEDFQLYNVEHPCGVHGFVDMVYSDSVTHYPIEVKKDEGKHDLISQISKYDLSFKLHLHLKIYRRVTPVTICASYQNNIIKELKSRGVQVLLYHLVGGRVKLSAV
jgi:hypothetical protein